MRTIPEQDDVTPAAAQQPLFGMPATVATSDDYYTPRWVFDALGLEFDLDVASPPGGSAVPAKRYLTVEDDGLACEWEGRVWMNPPYSGVRPWWERFKAHRNGVALLPFAKSAWLSDAWDAADGIVVLPAGGNVEFSRPSGPPSPIWLPVFAAAFGGSNVHAISRLGRVR